MFLLLLKRRVRKTNKQKETYNTQNDDERRHTRKIKNKEKGTKNFRKQEKGTNGFINFFFCTLKKQNIGEKREGANKERKRGRETHFLIFV